MGIWRRLVDAVRPPKPMNAISLDDLLAQAIGGRTASGASVTWESALKQTTALRCGLLIADGISTVPCKLMRMDAQGKRSPAKDHPLYDLLANRPNDWQTSVELRETLALHTVFTGNAFCFVNRVRGQVTELLPYEPKAVQVMRDGWQLSYRATTGAGMQELPAAQIWHLRGPSWNSFEGMNPVAMAKEAIGLAMATEQAHASRFGSGIQTTGVYAVDGKLTDEQYKRLSAWVTSHMAGAHNSGKPLVLDSGAKWTPLELSGVDAQHLETRRYQVEEICRAFGVMPIMVGYSDKAATYASAEQMFLAHATHTIRPWHRRFEASMNASLLTRQERQAGFYFKFIETELLRGAAKDRAEYYDRMFRLGALSPNRILELEDEDGYAGGDWHYVPMNMMTVEGGSLAERQLTAPPPQAPGMPKKESK